MSQMRTLILCCLFKVNIYTCTYSQIIKNLFDYLIYGSLFLSPRDLLLEIHHGTHE